jgi:site-specific recombinase XerD
MSRAELIYPLRKRIDQELAKAGKDPHNSEMITRYYKVRSSEAQPATVLTDLIRLNKISPILGKPFEQATRQDIENLIFRIDQLGNAPRTINKCREIIRNLYRWMNGLPKGQYPDMVRWISMKKVPPVAVTAEDLIPYDLCVKISEQAVCMRDRALFKCKLDAGCRIGEILTPKIGEVHFNEDGAIVYSDGKTGRQPCILTWSASTLAEWLNNHPFRDDKEAPVFCLHREKPVQMSYSAAYRSFKIAVKKAGVKKRVWPHLFKHVSSTEDSLRGVPDSYRRFKHHWTPNSDMPRVYEHLSNAVIPSIQKDAWNRFAGQERKESEKQEEEIVLSIGCRRCQFDNSRDSIYCNRCGYPLDEREAAEKSITKTRVDELVARLSEKPELVEKLLAVVKP